ncbi:hypothetical protein [Pseudolactococcus laudensis]|uniref:hypothetical protein n=1 Tax=Pseudolactococcus laudensis TaxID=1494461 RepID=UPI002FCC1159
MKIVASNSLTISNVNDGTITHVAYANSSDGTDSFTTVYPNLNLLDDTATFDKTNPNSSNYSVSTITKTMVSGITNTVMDVKTSGNAFAVGYYLRNACNITAGQTITISFMAKSLNDTKVVVGFERFPNWQKMFTITPNWKIYTYTFTATSSGTPTFVIYGYDMVAGQHFQVYNPKVEEGSTVTPYMPSAGEVTTADWPRYIGQYTNDKVSDSTNPTDYTWSLIRGNDGKDGATGKDGVAGKDGVGIKTTVITYALSSSGTDKPNTSWTSQVPTLVKGQYLWTKTVWTYSDTTSETGYTVSYIAKDGNNGNDGIAGKDGVGIKTTTIAYASHTNGTTAPATGYTTTVPSVPSGQFLWTKTIWTYTDKTSETGYSVARMGLKGDKGDPGNNGTNGIAGKDGTGIKTTTITYAVGTSGTTAPTSGWNSQVPIVPAGHYLWTKTVWDYTDKTSETGYSVARMGLKGDPGNNGTNGIAGKDGKGIKATAITYQASTNGTTAPTGTWSASVPTVAKGSFLWTRTIWTYTDNATETGYAVAYMGTNGNNGTNGIAGKDGTGIKKTTITYAGSTSGSTAPTNGWNSQVPNVPAGHYLWTKTVWDYTDKTSETGYSVARMGLKGDKGDPGNKGADGVSGIIVSSVAPTSPKTGQLWQDTSTTPHLVKKWTGASWVIWELYAHNLKADSLSALSANLGDVKAGTVKLMADNMLVNGHPKMYGIYQSKLGLLSSGPSLATPSVLSNSQMGVANLNEGELRFIVTDYTEDLKDVQERGMSDRNNAFIKFNSYNNGKDVMLIGSSGDIVFKGNTSQDTPWVTISSGIKYKFMFSRVYISVDIVGDGNQYMLIGIIPQDHRPIMDQFLILANWGTGVTDDRHIQVRVSDGQLILWAPKSGVKYRGEVSYTL